MSGQSPSVTGPSGPFPLSCLPRLCLSSVTATAHKPSGLGCHAAARRLHNIYYCETHALLRSNFCCNEVLGDRVTITTFPLHEEIYPKTVTMDSRRVAQRTAFGASSSTFSVSMPKLASPSFGAGSRSPVRASVSQTSRKSPTRSPTKVRALTVEQQLRNGKPSEGPTQGDFLRAAKARRQQGVAQRKQFDGEPCL